MRGSHTLAHIPIGHSGHSDLLTVIYYYNICMHSFRNIIVKAQFTVTHPICSDIARINERPFSGQKIEFAHWHFLRECITVEYTLIHIRNKFANYVYYYCFQLYTPRVIASRFLVCHLHVNIRTYVRRNDALHNA